MVRERRLALIVAQTDLDSEGFYSSAVRQAIRESYRLDQRIGEYALYRPETPTTGPVCDHRPEWLARPEAA